MSESQTATEIVHTALQALHELGATGHVPREALARLAETAGATPAAPTAPGARVVRENAPSSEAPSAARTNRTTASRPDMAATLAAKFAAEDAKPKAAPSAPSVAPASDQPVFVKIPGATAIAPVTGTKAERLAALREPVLACTKCPQLVASRKQVVFGVGNPEAELMFVGEAPGADEDTVGEPFVGRAGQLLTKIIETMGLRRSDVYIANILKCRPNMPPGEPGNRKPTPDEMSTCKPYLLEQINIIQPRVIVALGATGVEGLFGIEKAGITRIRGQWRDFHGIPVMPTFHPSYLLRPSADMQANKRLVWEDMLTVMEKLGMPINEKQRGFFLSRG
jgi:uracil-DNA glycosylase